MSPRHIALSLSVALLALPAWSADAPAPAPAVPDNTPRLASGLLMRQGGKLVMAPCRERDYAFLEDTSAGGKLLAVLEPLGLAAGKPLYVEIFGVLDGGTLRASSLNMARASARCLLPGRGEEVWRAAGEGWSLASSATHVRLRRTDQPDLLLEARTHTAGETTDIEASAPAGALSARLERGICRADGGETVFGWTARVNVGGQTLQGCAWQR